MIPRPCDTCGGKGIDPWQLKGMALICCCSVLPPGKICCGSPVSPADRDATYVCPTCQGAGSRPESTIVAKRHPKDVERLAAT